MYIWNTSENDTNMPKPLEPVCMRQVLACEQLQHEKEKAVAMIENAITWAVLLTIRKQHTANIYAGTKTAELRKTLPKFMPGTWEPVRYPLRVYMYESKADGGAGAITGFFDCPAFIGTKPGTPEEKYHPSFAQRAQVPPEFVEEYGGGGWVYAWEVRNPTRFPEPVALAAIGIDRAPQSWRYLGTDACTTLEVAARGSPAK